MLAPRKPEQPTPPPALQSITLPAPIGGLNTVDAGASMPPTDCILLYNMIAAEYGLRSRLGYRDWVTGLDGPVLTVIPFTGSTSVQNKLFAVTATGIWDCSSSTGAPTAPVFRFTSPGPGSGTGNSTVFVALDGRHYCLYADEGNGYFVYNEATSTWVQVVYGVSPVAGQINGAKPGAGANIDPARLCQVCVWANRVWLVEKESGYAWYGGLNSLYGTFTPFRFGSQFRAGGDLRGLFNWTIDGGSGVTNSLVAVSGGGDIVVYQGTDPSDINNFALKGVWFCGGVPAGRRVATDLGGDMLVLSSIGVVPMSRITQGNPVFDRSTYATHKISNLFNQLAYSGRDLAGWHLVMHPQDNALIVNVPQADAPTVQLVMSLATKGWSQYRDLPNVTASAAYQGTWYFGTDDGRICVSADYLDAVPLDGSTFSPIQWEVLSAFQNLGTARKKRVAMVRPTVLAAGGAPAYACEPRFGYDFTELPPVAVLGTQPNGINSQFVMAAGLSDDSQVFVNRVLQILNTDYTYAGAVITFLPGAIPLADAVIKVFISGPSGARAAVGLATPGGLGSGSQWDGARWDVNHWSGELSPTQDIGGTTGIGQDVAIIIRGTATSRTSLVGIDVFYEMAGYL